MKKELETLVSQIAEYVGEIDTEQDIERAMRLITSLRTFVDARRGELVQIRLSRETAQRNHANTITALEELSDYIG